MTRPLEPLLISRNSLIRWAFFALAALLVTASVVLPMVVAAQEAPATACAHPRAAADSIFKLQEGKVICVDAVPGKRAKLATQLQQILDARGLYMPVASLSEKPDFANVDGANQVQPLPATAPWIVLVREDDGRWLYARETMDQVPTLYEQTFSSFSRWIQELLPATFQQRVPGIGGYGWQWVLGSALVLTASLIGLIVRFVVLAQVRRLAIRFKINVDRALVRRLDGPVMVFVIAGIVSWWLPDVQLPISISSITFLVLSIVVGFSGILVASRLVDIATGFWSTKTEETESKLDDQLVPLVRQISRMIVWAVGILFVLQNNGVQVWSFVAGLGIGSLAFALAAQDTVANLFGALNIFLDKPFQIGDAVKVGSVEGTVEEVGFRSFRVRTFYNSLVTIPNSTITTTNVDNLGLRHRRRAKLTLGLSYDTPPDTLHAFVEGVRAVLAAHPSVEKTYEVHFSGFGASSLDIMVYYHIICDTWTEELETKADNGLEFLRLAEALDVSFAFPSTSLYVESTPQDPMAARERPDLSSLEATASAFGPGGSAARPHGPEFAKSWAASELTARGGD